MAAFDDAIKLLTESNWFTTITKFRRNPREFLQKNKRSEEAFVIDILQLLWDDKISSQIKIHLLGILKEYGNILFLTSASVEQAIGTVMDIYKQLPQEGNNTLKSQLLVTVVTLTLVNNIQGTIASQFAQVVELLLEVAAQSNSISNRAVRTAACQGLHEIELFYPGSLMYKLEYMYHMSQVETSPACQAYLSLFATTLAHTVKVLCLQHKPGVPSHQLSSLLTIRSETLKPYNFPKISVDYKTITKMAPGLRLQNQDVTDLKRAISFLLDHTYLLATPTLVAVLRTMADVVHRCDLIAPLIFKGAVLRYTHSYNIAVLGFVIRLKELFQDSLFQSQDTVNLVNSLLSQMTQQSLPPAHRLLMYEWLTHLPNKHDNENNICIAELPNFKCYGKIFPAVFDGTDTVMKKMQLLSNCLLPMDDEDMIAATLTHNLQAVIKPLQYGVMGRTPVSVFTIFFICYTSHQHWEFLERLKQLLVDLLLSQPKYIPHMLDMIEALEYVQADRSLTSDLLSTMMLSMTCVTSTLPSSEQDMQHRLMLLQQITTDTQTKPQMILGHLVEITKNVMSQHSGSWLLGNLLLNVVRSLMQFYATDAIYTELGDLLQDIMTNYKDTDIQDGAKFYLSLMFTLSAEKLMWLFNQSDLDLTDNSGMQNLDNILADNSAFSNLLSVVSFKEPVLLLTRINGTLVDREMLNEDTSDSVTDLFNFYQSFWQQKPHVHKLNLQFILDMNRENYPELNEVYGVVLKFTPEDHFLPIPDKSISVISKDAMDDDEVYITVSISPVFPAPGNIAIVAYFTDSEGCTCRSDLDDLRLTFSDLCTTLPCPASWNTETTAALFGELWSHFTDDSTEGYLQSVMRLSIGKENVLQLLQTTWKRFIIHRNEPEVQAVLAMFMPPKSHLLLKVKLDGHHDNCIVSMATDNDSILPVVSDYLRLLENS